MSSPVIGKLRGHALVYDVLDSAGTSFDRGSLDCSVPRVDMGLVDLYWKHGKQRRGAERDPALRIGRVTELRDVRLEDGRWVAEIEATVFDSPDARVYFDAIEGVFRDGCRVGLSISFPMDRAAGRWDYKLGRYRYTEVPLTEISVCPTPAVPGAQVSSVTRRPAEGWVSLAERLALVRRLDTPRTLGKYMTHRTGWITEVNDRRKGRTWL